MPQCRSRSAFSLDELRLDQLRPLSLPKQCASARRYSASRLRRSSRPRQDHAHQPSPPLRFFAPRLAWRAPLACDAFILDAALFEASAASRAILACSAALRSASSFAALAAASSAVPDPARSLGLASSQTRSASMRSSFPLSLPLSTSHPKLEKEQRCARPLRAF